MHGGVPRFRKRGPCPAEMALAEPNTLRWLDNSCWRPPGEQEPLACEIIAKVTTGKPMFNCRGLRSPHGVILLAGEDNLSETIKPRLVAAGALRGLCACLIAPAACFACRLMFR